MIDLNHKYALLENGDIESLWYDFNNGYREQREVEEENGEYYLNYDRWQSGDNWSCVSRIHSKIIKTANNQYALEEYRRTPQRTEEKISELITEMTNFDKF